ncbi:outer membrane biogenesis protein BamB [Roseimaritima multifibrata]|uniref:Outer membrane biogenesis protein BamB n=1 Tax=Roseimaritima multifibrata TaxID=1930274 RepID=A0A517MAJ8_9BACT|nr:outer membrane biogenesis protein BamB [Roseimaritima multifibrata]
MIFHRIGVSLRRFLTSPLASLSAGLLFWIGACGLTAQADDWPQWMGTHRDNVWRENNIVESFPDDGPSVVWRIPVAGGYAGPAVANGRVYVTDYVTAEDVQTDNFNRETYSGTERVLCLDERDGRLIWKHEYPVTYGISYPAGPRCTPTVDGNNVYTLGAEGDLYCFDAATGEVLWNRSLPTDYDAKTPLWGYAAHPLIDGPRLITLAGGKGSHVVALDKQTGKEIWRHGTTREPGYSPPTIIQAGGKRQLILLHPEAMESVVPESGQPYWSVPYTADNGSIIMSPVQSGDLLYGGGFSRRNLLVRLSKDGLAAETVWQDERNKGLSPVNVQPFAEDGILYGADQDGTFYGVQIETGERLWKSTAPLDGKRPLRTGTAIMVRNQGRVWMFNERGELVIAKMTPAGYEEIDRAKVIEPSNTAAGRSVVWTAPAWANQSVFIRNDKECIRVDLSAD